MAGPSWLLLLVGAAVTINCAATTPTAPPVKATPAAAATPSSASAALLSGPADDEASFGKPCSGQDCPRMNGRPMAPRVRNGGAPSPDETRAQCTALLARFGAEAQADELEECTREIESGGGWCPEGQEDVYRSCVRGCLETISLTEADYASGDVSSSPMKNCAGGCKQTTCGNGPP